MHRRIEILAFQDNGLRIAFQRSTQLDAAEMDRVDAVRPTKRLRLSDQTLSGIKTDLESEWTGKLYELMAMDKGVNLDSPGQAALFVDNLSQFLQPD